MGGDCQRENSAERWNGQSLILGHYSSYSIAGKFKPFHWGMKIAIIILLIILLIRLPGTPTMYQFPELSVY